MKKMISLILCVLLFAACISASAFAADAKVLKVATNVAFPPYEYMKTRRPSALTSTSCRPSATSSATQWN